MAQFVLQKISLSHENSVIKRRVVGNSNYQVVRFCYFFGDSVFNPKRSNFTNYASSFCE